MFVIERYDTTHGNPTAYFRLNRSQLSGTWRTRCTDASHFLGAATAQLVRQRIPGPLPPGVRIVECRCIVGRDGLTALTDRPGAP